MYVPVSGISSTFSHSSLVIETVWSFLSESWELSSLASISLPAFFAFSLTFMFVYLPSLFFHVYVWSARMYVECFDMCVFANMHIRRHKINIENLSSSLSNLISEAVSQSDPVPNNKDSSHLNSTPLDCTATTLMTEPSPSPVPSYFSQTKMLLFLSQGQIPTLTSKPFSLIILLSITNYTY